MRMNEKSSLLISFVHHKKKQLKNGSLEEIPKNDKMIITILLFDSKKVLFQV